MSTKEKQATSDPQLGACESLLLVREEDSARSKRTRVFGDIVGGGRSVSGSIATRVCQADNCDVNLIEEKAYHRRHRVCEVHAKLGVVTVAGIKQRFCQQCSRFHELSEFDESKRSCRKRLAGHNERRRKAGAESETRCDMGFLHINRKDV